MTPLLSTTSSDSSFSSFNHGLYTLAPIKYNTFMHFMWRHAFNTHPHNNNNVGLHTFVHGEKLDLKITSELKGTILGTSRNVGKQQCLIICNWQGVEKFARFLFHTFFKHILSHVHIMEQKISFHFQNQSWKQQQQFVFLHPKIS